MYETSSCMFQPTRRQLRVEYCDLNFNALDVFMAKASPDSAEIGK